MTPLFDNGIWKCGLQNMDYLVYLESSRSQLEDRICERGYVYREVRLRPSLARKSERFQRNKSEFARGKVVQNGSQSLNRLHFSDAMSRKPLGLSEWNLFLSLLEGYGSRRNQTDTLTLSVRARLPPGSNFTPR